jgi:excisionase family DNA binding protein
MSSNIDIKKICSWCGAEFIAHKTTTTCCSHRCANALYKKRKRDEVIKTNNQFTEKIVIEKPIEKIKDKPFITITEAAVYLGVTRPTLYSYLKNGELKASRLGCKYLLRKDDIDELFNRPTEFRIQSKERAPITEFYTTAEVKEKYNVVDSWIFVVAKKHNIPRTFNRGKTYWSKKHIDNYFSKKAANPEITEWYTVQEIQDKFDMTLAAIYTLALYQRMPFPKRKRAS